MLNRLKLFHEIKKNLRPVFDVNEKSMHSPFHSVE